MYQVRFTSTALQQLDKLDKSISQQVLKRLKWLAEHFEEYVPIP
jgi:mRNA-degrading endonuclease RelE of RelBE toxin-antitoxin system